MKVWLNGKMVDQSKATVSVLDHGVLYGDGVFEGIRVYNGRVFQGPAHLDRLFRSADEVRLKIPYTRRQLSEAMDKTIAANGRPYIRLVVTRGAGNLGLNPFQCSRPTVYVINDSIQLYPKDLYEKGLCVVLARTRRTSATMLPPCVKSLNYLNNIMARIEAIDAGASEALMLNDRGNLAEATGDNVFIVKRGRLMTPPTSAGILIGVTRGIVLKLAKRLGIPAVEKDFKPAQLYAADECFLTGTAAEVVPVTHVDGRRIGKGVAGPVTQRLMAAFAEFIRKS